MDRTEVAQITWAIVYAVLANISLFLGMHESGEPWNVLHWILAFAFSALSASFMWVLIEDRRASRRWAVG